MQRVLLRPPREAGFDLDHWSLAAIALLIERFTGVRYHRRHLGRLLRRSGWVVPPVGPRAAQTIRVSDVVEDSISIRVSFFAEQVVPLVERVGDNALFRAVGALVGAPADLVSPCVELASDHLVDASIGGKVDALEDVVSELIALDLRRKHRNAAPIDLLIAHQLSVLVVLIDKLCVGNSIVFLIVDDPHPFPPRPDFPCLNYS